MSWRNPDGLLVKFGTEKATATKGGMRSSMDGRITVGFVCDLDDATSTDAAVPDTDTVWLPTGVYIDKVKLTVLETVADTDDSANLDLGLGYYNASGTLTAVDYDGLLIAADGFVNAVAGEIYEYKQGDTDHGALVGTQIATSTLYDKCYFTFSEETGAFTAGQFWVEVSYYVPDTPN